MSTGFLLLEINDQALSLSQCQDGVAIERHLSPGFALYEQQWLSVGDDAKSQFRLRPRSGNSDFWSQLSLNKLANATDLIAHNADLVYHHLRQLLENLNEPPTGPFFISLPGYYQAEQIALLLGICEHLQRPVQGIINRALIDCAHLPDGRYLHVDMHLHQTHVSQVAIDHRTATLENSQTLTGCGRTQINDACVAAIADEFIKQTRFNPVHDAELEQTLYNGLEDTLEALARGENRVQLGEQSALVDLVTVKDASLRATTKLSELLASHQDLHPLLTSENNKIKTLLPFLNQSLNPAPEQVAKNCQHLLAQIITEDSHDGLLQPDSLILGKTAKPQVNQTSSSQAPVNTPSHILLNGQATAIKPGFLSAEVQQLQNHEQNALCQLNVQNGQLMVEPIREDCLLNGQPLSQPCALSAGDTISNAATHYQFIRVHG